MNLNCSIHAHARMGDAAIACALFGLGFFTQRNAQAGHVSLFHPSFYPKEVRIETLSPATAVAGRTIARVHAYVRKDFFSGGRASADAMVVESRHFRRCLALQAIFELQWK